LGKTVIITPTTTIRAAQARVAGDNSLSTSLSTPPALERDPIGKASCAREAVFCRRLEDLSRWKRRYMPILDMPQGGDVLVWLLKGSARSRPLKDLYRGSRFSEPTIRWVLKALVDGGYIMIERHPEDRRVRTVQTTPKLATAMRTYLQLVRACAVAQAANMQAAHMQVANMQVANLESANREAGGPVAPVRLSTTEAPSAATKAVGLLPLPPSPAPPPCTGPSEGSA
jgi:DNA-binding MarR family transcriptional regulator